jgi:hypothetical protein
VPAGTAGVTVAARDHKMGHTWSLAHHLNTLADLTFRRAVNDRICLTNRYELTGCVVGESGTVPVPGAAGRNVCGGGQMVAAAA